MDKIVQQSINIVFPGYTPCDIPCRECGSINYVYEKNENGIHCDAYCADCGTWIKHVPLEENALNKWARKIKERDRYICQHCKRLLIPHEAEAHHKLPTWMFPELKLDLNNGICLCKACHKQIHGNNGTIRGEN